MDRFLDQNQSIATDNNRRPDSHETLVAELENMTDEHDVRSAVLTEDEPADTGPIPNGENVYELFSILIHSGGAYGGHYYAFIKVTSLSSLLSQIPNLDGSFLIIERTEY